MAKNITDPTYPLTGLAPVLERNIQALRLRRQHEDQAASWQEKLADRITTFTGSMSFVCIHLVAVAVWIICNLGWLPGISPWDPSFVVLAMIASVEAIFISTFVLIAQNRMTAAAGKRADLDLQISLLTEHELTKLASLLSDMAKQLGVATPVEREIQEVKRDIAPDAVLDKIEQEDGLP